MPETGCLHGAPKVMPTTYPSTSKKLLMSLGGSVGACSLPRKKRNGMSISSLALLDRIIPTTSGGINQSSISNMVLNLILNIMTISYVVLVAIAKKMIPDESSLNTVFPLSSYYTVPNCIRKDCRGRKYETSLTVSLLSILQKWTQRLEQCVLNWCAEKKKLSSDSLMLDSPSLPPSLDTTRSTEECLSYKMNTLRRPQGPYPWHLNDSDSD